ncbi:MAG: TonB-dependent receptor plug domain-containing protein, partial [Desulfamplus sp.]|nr:TonB-dependent receptor plug domain-containing protein [Desulfamplus sp.]
MLSKLLLNHLGLTFAALFFYCFSIFSPISVLADQGKSSVEALADLSIEQLMSIEVSSTSFFDVAPEKAPGSLYLISQEQIEKSYSSSISDFLQYYVPGVHISGAYSSGSLYSTRGIASSSNVTTLFMLNGTNMNVSSGTGINTNLNLPLLGDVERIEVLKGPCSIIHGSGSINGFINVIPKNGKDNRGGFINTEVGLKDGLVKAESGYGSFSPEYGDIFIYAGGVKSDGINENGKYIKIGDNPDRFGRISINDNHFSDINSRFSLNWNRDNLSIIGVVQNEKVESTLPWKPYFNQPSSSNSNEIAGTTDQNSLLEEDIVSYYNKNVMMKSMVLLPELKLDLTQSEKLTIGLPI